MKRTNLALVTLLCLALLHPALAMDLQLGGKTALVTGSTAGIGFGIAKVLLKEGTRVIINGRTQDSLDEAAAKSTCTRLRGQGLGCIVVKR